MENSEETERRKVLREKEISNIISEETILAIDDAQKICDQCKVLQITNESEFAQTADYLQTIKGLRNKIQGQKQAVKSRILNEIDSRFNNVEFCLDDAENCLKKLLAGWNVKITKKIEDEKAEKKKKAEEETARIQKELESEILREQEKANVLEAKKKAKIEEEKELKRKRDEEQKKALQALNQLENQLKDAKKEIKKDPNRSEEIGKEIGNLEIQKKSVVNGVKKIDVEVNNVKHEIKLISEEEMAYRNKAQKLSTEKDSVVVRPQPPSMGIPKYHGLTFANKPKYRVTDINLVPEELTEIKLNSKVNKKKLKDLVPREWLDITIDDKAVKDTMKKLGNDALIPGIIPGIEIYEDKIVRSTSIFSDKKEKKEMKEQKTKNGMES